jgi:hypothetical protein
MQFVDHDDPELLEQLEPLGVVREDRRVEHVRVRDHDLSGGAHRRADRGRRVAVVRRGQDRQPGGCRELAEFADLILAERLGREQEQRAGSRVIGDGLHRGHRVAQGLARRRRSHDDDVLAAMDGFDRLRLVGVQALDPATRQALGDPRVQPRRHLGVGSLASRDDRVMDHAAGHRWFVEDAVENGRSIGRGVRAHGSIPYEQNRCSDWSQSSVNPGPRA